MQYSQQPCFYYPFYQPQVYCPIFYYPVQAQQEIYSKISDIPKPQIEISSTHTQNHNLTSNNETEEEIEKSFEQKEISEQESIQIKQKKTKTIKKLKIIKVLDSTNLHKNFTKAIVAYATRQQFVIYKLLGEQKGQEFLELMQTLKNKLSNLTHISKYTKNDEMLRAFRIIGLNFLKRESVPYIYNSKIQQKTSHLKHKALIKKTLLRI